jgi:hypothetical protein
MLFAIAHVYAVHNVMLPSSNSIAAAAAAAVGVNEH